MTYSPVQAQAPRSASVAGRVIHAVTNEPLPGAAVLLLGTTQGQATDLDGWFAFRNLSPGRYSLRVSMIGFTPQVFDSVKVGEAEVTNVAIRLAESEIGMAEVLIVDRRITSGYDFPVSTKSTGYLEMRQSAGAMEDVARVVASLPGVAQVYRDRNEIMVRGGSPAENLYLVDNFEFPNINHFGVQGGGGGAVSFINMDLLQSFSFSTGGYGVRYGDRMSSVFSQWLRNGREDRHGIKVIASATQFGVSGEGPLLSDGSYLFSIRRSFLELLFKAYGFPYAPAFWDFTLKLQRTLGPSDHLRLLAVGAADRVERDNETAEDKRENSRMLFSDQVRLVGGLAWRHVLDVGLTEIQIRHSNTRIGYIQSSENLTPPPLFQGSAVEEETSVRVDALFQVTQGTELSAGIEGKSLFLAGDFSANASYSVYAPRIFIRVDGHSDTNSIKGAAYVQLAQSAGPLSIALGVRADYFNLISEPVVVAPRLSIGCALTYTTRLTASIGRSYQAPSYIWIMSNAYNKGLPYLAADHVVLGLEHHFTSDWKITAEIYEKRYRDYPTSLARPYLVMVNSGVGLGGLSEGYASFGFDSLVSRGSGLSHGAEVFVQKRLSDSPWYGKSSISYNVSRFEALDGVWRPSDYDQRWIVSVGAGYLSGDTWEFSGLFRYYTGRPYTPFFGPTVFVRSWELYNNARIGDNHSLDVRVARYWNAGSLRLSAFLDVMNVYNRKPLDIPYADTYNKKITQRPTLGIVPSAGVSVEF